MFNRFVKLYLNSDFWFLRLNKRIKSLTLEMWYTLSIFFPLLAVLQILTILFWKPFQTNFGWIDLVTLIPFNLMIVVLFNKDFFNGQSVVHRQLGYKVLDARTKEPATKIQCLTRNITAPIWPIEVILVLAVPNRRLGDFIAGTILADVPVSDPKLILGDMKKSNFDRQAKLTLIASVVFVGLFIFIFDHRISLR